LVSVAEADVKKAVAATGLDGDAVARTFEAMRVDEHNRAAFERALAFAGEVVAGTARRGLYIYGPRTGTGKSHLAAAIVNHVAACGVFARFMRVVEIPRGDQEALEDLSNADWPLLVLDDVGAAKNTARLVECLYCIIDGRCWSGAPVVLTSNMGPDALGAHLGELDKVAGARIASRLVEACEMVPLAGPDRRRVGRRG